MAADEHSANDSAATCCVSDIDSVLSPELFRVLADPNRRAILSCLARCGGSQTVGGVAEELPVDLSVVSRHLGVLREAGVLSSHREGKSVRYRICCEEVVTQLRALADSLEQCCLTDQPENTGETSPSKRSTRR